jgi:hypothetical protein
MLWSHAGGARGQGVYYPVHRTSQGTPDTTVIRGQDAGELPPFEDDSDTLELAPVVDLEVSETNWFSEGGWYSAVDVGAMKQSDSLFGINGNTWGDEAAAPRLTIGWENEEGIGVRGELWHYQSESANPYADARSYAWFFPEFYGASPTRPQFAMQLREEVVTTLDLDVYKHVVLEGDEVTFGTGVKAASESDTAPTTDMYWGRTSRLSGVGFSLFANARKSIYAADTYDVAFIAGGRASCLWGESEYSNHLYSQQGSERFGIYEASAGVEWRRELPNSVVYLRTQYETQLWDLHGDATVGFTGANVSLGITW